MVSFEARNLKKQIVQIASVVPAVLRRILILQIYRTDSEKIEVPDVIIKEWVWSKSNPYQTPESVKAEQIGWGVPTIQRLWFG